MLPKILKGIIPPIVTPLLSPEKLDTDGLQKLIEHVITGGVHGIFVLGTTGEGPSLSKPLQFELIQRSTEQISGRIPVLVGISSASFGNSLELAEHAASCGADAVVLAPPYYFPSGQPELLEYLEHLAPRLPLPLFLYNMPSMTKNYLSPQLVEKLAGLPWISGCKDSSGNMSDFHDLLLRLGNKDDFSIFIGPEELISDAILAGADGAVTGGANVNPALFVNMFHAACNKDMAAVNELLPKIYHLRRLYSVVSTPNAIARGLKCAVKELGICEDFPVAPCRTFDDLQRAEVIRLLKEMSAELAVCR